MVIELPSGAKILMRAVLSNPLHLDSWGNLSKLSVN
jgi:hypothetical protein